MISRFKNLSLLSKSIFFLSLLLLIIWVIPTMVNYYSNVQKYDEKVQKLQVIASENGVEGEVQVFNKETFKEDTEHLFSKVSIKSTGESLHTIVMEMEKDKVTEFNRFLETLSLRYLVKVEGALAFEEKDKILQVKMKVREL